MFLRVKESTAGPVVNYTKAIIIKVKRMGQENSSGRIIPITRGGGFRI